jgi:hypothetical protein
VIQEKNDVKIISQQKLNQENCYKIIQLITIILIIPLQMICQSLLMNSENRLIVYIQNNFMNRFPTILQIFKFIFDLGSTENTLVSQVFIFLAFDSLQAFKTTITYCFGVYIFMIFKLAFREPRPFWTDE